MTAKEQQKLIDFFSTDRKCFEETVSMLLNTLAKEITFRLKIQKASIHLCDRVSFAVIAFRRSLPYFFIEFYNADKIVNPRIVKTITKSEKLVINRVNILSSNDIDSEFLNWIQKSQVIAK
jgi:hypothetical protein